jgi:hypothetical protein
MDSKDIVNIATKQWTTEDGTITWRRYNEIRDKAPLAEGAVLGGPTPASNHSIDNIRDTIRREVQTAVAHLVAEIDSLTQRCEELEVELVSRADLAEYPVLGEGD